MMGRGIFCRWFSTAVAEFGHQKPSRRTLAEKAGQAYGRGSKITHYGFEKLVEREIILSRILARQTARVRMLLSVTYTDTHTHTPNELFACIKCCILSK